MMEDHSRINGHLPVFGEREYTARLYNAFEANYASGVYQFAFLAYYMLLMSFVSFKIWQVNRSLSGRATLSKTLQKHLRGGKPPLTLDTGNATINRSVLKFIESILPTSTLAFLMRFRNSIVHANGNIRMTTPDVFDQVFAEIWEVINGIQRSIKPTIEIRYFNFLLDSRNPEEREHIEDEDQINEVLIRENHLSEQDIAYCVGYNIAILMEHQGFDEMKSLHETLLRLYPPETI